MKILHPRKFKQPSLRFSPTAWAKLIFMRDLTDNEVGGFGISDADDLLFVTDFVLVKQEVSMASVSFDDESVADFFDEMIEAGKTPQQFARIWLHTHPGNSPQPSGTDESTFERVFGSCDWSVMAIVAKNNDTFARLRFNTGPSGEISLPVCIDYASEFEATNFDKWKRQYTSMVTEEIDFLNLPTKSKKKKKKTGGTKNHIEDSGLGNICPLTSSEILEQIEAMDPHEQELLFEELGLQSDCSEAYWDNYWEGGFIYE